METPTIETDIAIIGGGPGGLAAAKEAARLDAKVTVIEQDKAGGRALWHSLVPSKVWLHAANILGETSHAKMFGLSDGKSTGDPTSLLQRLASVKETEDQHNQDDFQELGINTISGAARFTGEHTLAVTKDGKDVETIRADNIIVATGSVPLFPDGLKPDGKRILAPRFMSKLETIPKSMIIVGGGVTGSEVIYLFNRLGTQVTVVTDIDTLLPRADQDVSLALESILKSRGVTFHKNLKAEKVVNTGSGVEVHTENDRLSAEYAFVAIGRKSDTGTIDAKAAGISLGEYGKINVNDRCQTSADHIYAIGDVTGAPMLANKAMAQGRIAARNALTNSNKVYHSNWTVEVVYTEPEVAQVGMNETNAEEQKVSFSVKKTNYNRNLKANISGHSEGFLKVVTENNSGKILGATAIGDHAGDILTPFAVALRSELTLNELVEIAPANPTLSELITELQPEIQ